MLLLPSLAEPLAIGYIMSKLLIAFSFEALIMEHDTIIEKKM